MEEVLIRLLEKQLRYKSEKCELYKKKIVFLRLLMEKENIKMNLFKIEKILDWPQSKNFQEL